MSSAVGILENTLIAAGHGRPAFHNCTGKVSAFSCIATAVLNDGTRHEATAEAPTKLSAKHRAAYRLLMNLNLHDMALKLSYVALLDECAKTSMGTANTVDYNYKGGLHGGFHCTVILRQRDTGSIMAQAEGMALQKAAAQEVAARRLVASPVYRTAVLDGYITAKRGSGHDDVLQLMRQTAVAAN